MEKTDFDKILKDGMKGKTLKQLISRVSMMQIPKMALLEGVLREMRGREAFIDSILHRDERIYHGDVFEAILGDAEMKMETQRPSKEITDQLEELSKIVSADYIMLTNI